MGALSGSRPTGQAPSGLDASRFDPARIAEYIAARLGKAQRRVILSLTEEWGEAACHQTARRMFYGVTGQHFTVVQHKHCTDNCWRLSDLGSLVKDALAAATGTAETNEDLAQAEGSQSGPKGNAQTPSPDSSS